MCVSGECRSQAQNDTLQILQAFLVQDCIRPSATFFFSAVAFFSELCLQAQNTFNEAWSFFWYLKKA